MPGGRIDRIAILQREVGDDRRRRQHALGDAERDRLGRLPVLRLAGAEGQQRDEPAVLLDDAIDVDPLGLGARLGVPALFFLARALGLLELALLERVDALRLAVAHVLEEAHGDRRIDDRIELIVGPQRQERRDLLLGLLLLVDEEVGEREQLVRGDHVVLGAELDRRVEQGIDGVDGAPVVAAIVGGAPLVERVLGVARRIGRARGADDEHDERGQRRARPLSFAAAAFCSSATLCTCWSLARSSSGTLCEA